MEGCGFKSNSVHFLFGFGFSPFLYFVTVMVLMVESTRNHIAYYLGVDCSGIRGYGTQAMVF